MSKKTEDGSSSAKRHFAEEVGLMFDQEGLPQMAGRIWGWMLICESPQVSLQELAEVLNASKGSISTMSRLLIRAGVIERIAIPGHRRDHVRLKSGGWTHYVEESMLRVSAYRALAERGLELLEGKDPTARATLTELRDLYAFFEQEMPALMDRWERKRKSAR
ncbi:MAG: MarR family transcriptional regulator [Chloroflexi bacterium]|nr:MarR family transcriptional regulator [Chloroflexota bacterium]